MCTLTIDEVSYEDAGTITVMVTNPAGSDRAHAKLTVTGKISVFNVSSCQETGITSRSPSQSPHRPRARLPKFCKKVAEELTINHGETLLIEQTVEAWPEPIVSKLFLFLTVLLFEGLCNRQRIDIRANSSTASYDGIRWTNAHSHAHHRLG